MHEHFPFHIKPKKKSCLLRTKCCFKNLDSASKIKLEVCLPSQNNSGTGVYVISLKPLFNTVQGGMVTPTHQGIPKGSVKKRVKEPPKNEEGTPKDQ